MAKRFSDFSVFDDDDADGDDSESLGFKKFENKSNAIIYMIDARKKMFLPSDNDNNIPFAECLKCVRSAIRNKIFCQEKALCGIALLGTDKTNNQSHMDHINVIQPLERLKADHILTIDKMLQAVHNSTYEKEYGHNDFSLADSFLLASRIFQDQTIKINKEIILFTNEDSPSVNHPNDKKRAIINALDMAQNHISLDLIHLGENFDVDKFYKEIIQVSKDDTNYVIPDPVIKLEEMLQRISKANYRYVTMVKLPFVVSEDFQCSVAVRSLVSKSKKPSKTKLSKATNDKVVSKVQLFEAETGDLVKKENLVHVQTVALQDITFKQKELQNINDMGERGFRLMGFKPASTVKLEHFVKPCAFIYPDESECKGSSAFFMALLKRCIAKQVVAICSYYPRTTSTVRFVALVAQDEVKAPDNTQETPPGFIVVFLPFAEEIRDLDERCTGKERASPEQVAIAKKLIKKLKAIYKPEFFSNPDIQTHWAAVEALALDQKESDEIKDNTLPQYDTIATRTDSIIQSFCEEIYTGGYDPKEYQRPVKRQKVSHHVDADADVDVAGIEEKIKQGQVTYLTNDALKIYLRSVGLGKGIFKMKKADLIQKACDYLDVPVP